MPEIIVVGEALVDLFAEPGVALADLPHFTPRFGGAPANVAAAAARLGGDVGFVGTIGDDGFGAALRTHLQSIGIDVTHLGGSHRPTMVACVALPTPDRQEFVLFEGANADLAIEDIDAEYLSTAHLMAFGSVTLAYASGTAALHAARQARQQGLHVVFDVNLRPAIWPDPEVARDKILEAVALSSAVKLNEDEARFLFGEVSLEEASSSILAMGPSLCCISRGDRGAYFRTAAGDGHVPGYEVDVVDTTGCGDAFLAGLAVRLAEAPAALLVSLAPDDVRDIIAFANACGAFVATELGAMDAPLTRQAAESLMKRATT